jgi:hypothetical protein
VIKECGGCGVAIARYYLIFDHRDALTFETPGDDCVETVKSILCGCVAIRFHD